MSVYAKKALISTIPVITCIIFITLLVNTSNPTPPITQPEAEIKTDSPQVIESIKTLRETVQSLTNFSIGLFVICGFFFNSTYSKKDNSTKKNPTILEGIVLLFFAISQVTSLVYGHRARMDMVIQLSLESFDKLKIEPMIVSQGFFLLVGFLLILYLISLVTEFK